MANYARPFLPFMQFRDTSGNLLSGGLLYFYEGGTSTPKDTWADGAMQTANDNPVELDSAGMATIFVNGLYKIVLKTSAGVTVSTWDYCWFPVITGKMATLLDDPSFDNFGETLGLGTAAYLDVGTSADNVVQLDDSAKLPAVDGSQLTNISASGVALPYNHISGLEFTRLTGTTFSISAGECRDSTDSYNVSLSSTITKSLSAWAEGTGNGSLDTGSLVPDTWYHVFAVGTADGDADIVISVEGNLTPTLTGLGDYDYYAFLGISFLLNGSSQIIEMHQDGDMILWDDPVLDVSATGIGTANADRTLTVPPDYQVEALINATFGNPDSPAAVYLRSLDVDNEAAAGDTTAPLATIVAPATNERYASGPVFVRTSTSQAIGSRANFANSSLDVCTLGWRYQRGK